LLHHSSDFGCHLAFEREWLPQRGAPMIFKTKNPEVVAYVRACRLRNMVASIMPDGGKATIRGKVLSIKGGSEPETHWVIDIETN
jgi:hypothetical protein